MSTYDHLGWTEANYSDVCGYYTGHGQRLGLWTHIMRATDAGPGAVSVGALCGGLQRVTVVGIRRDDDTRHTDGKWRLAPYASALAAVDAKRRKDDICPRCLNRALRARRADR